MGFPKDASSVNDISISLWQGAWIAGGVVGVITLVLLLWPAVFHRASASKGEFPKQTQYNIPVEILYTVIPFIIVFVLFYFTAIKQTEIVDKTSPVKHEINVNGFQWSWQFGYPAAGFVSSTRRESSLHFNCNRCSPWILDSGIYDSDAELAR